VAWNPWNLIFFLDFVSNFTTPTVPWCTLLTIDEAKELNVIRRPSSMHKPVINSVKSYMDV
jgi:hypothetical protein